MAEDGRIRCDACPVLCYIKPGMTGACDRYANDGGTLVRVDPQIVLDRSVPGRAGVVPFLEREAGLGRRHRGRPALSSPRSAPAPPIPTTSRPPSSSPPKSRAWTWSPS